MLHVDLPKKCRAILRYSISPKTSINIFSIPQGPRKVFTMSDIRPAATRLYLRPSLPWLRLTPSPKICTKKLQIITAVVVDIWILLRGKEISARLCWIQVWLHVFSIIHGSPMLYHSRDCVKSRGINSQTEHMVCSSEKNRMILLQYFVGLGRKTTKGNVLCQGEEFF